MNYKKTKSYAFIALYLMGLERYILEKDFFEDYTYSGGLTALESIEDARILRYASRIRQKIYRNYQKYRSTADFEAEAREHLQKEIEFLKERGIDLGKEFRSTSTIVPVVNKLTEVINEKLPGVLKRLNFPYPEVVKSVFYMYEVTDKTLDKYVYNMQGSRSKFPYMMFITRYSRLSTHLPLLFLDDRKFIIGCHHLAGVEYNPTELNIPTFDWESIGVDEPVQVPIEGSSVFYVDCDNVSYFTFVALLESLKNQAKPNDKYIINLYIDEDTSLLWKMTSHLEHPLFTFNLIEVDRVKDTKSVVDMVIASHITRDSMGENALPCVIVSSDSDYIGLVLAGIPLGGVFYELNSVNQEYITQLKLHKIKHFNIGSLASDKFKQEHENAIIRQMILDYLPTIPMVDWTVDNIKQFVLDRQTDIIEYEIELIEHNVVYQVQQVLQNIEVTLKGGKPEITLKEELVEEEENKLVS